MTAHTVRGYESRSSACTFSSQPYPSSCSIVRPVKSSHVLLKKVAWPSERDATIITGAVLARLRKRASLCRNRGFDAFALAAETRASQNVTPNAQSQTRAGPGHPLQALFFLRSADRKPRYHRARNMSISRSRPPARHLETCCRFRAGSGRLPRQLRRWKPRQHEISVQESSEREAAPRRTREVVPESRPGPPAPRRTPQRLSPCIPAFKTSWNSGIWTICALGNALAQLLNVQRQPEHCDPATKIALRGWACVQEAPARGCCAYMAERNARTFDDRADRPSTAKGPPALSEKPLRNSFPFRPSRV